MSYGSHEVLRAKDFGQFTEEELAHARAMIASLTWDPGMRRTRRWAPGRGGVLDLRRVVRRNIRYGGEPLSLPTRDRTLKPRPLVLISDVSGSMERYARMLLHFIYSLAAGDGRPGRAFASRRSSSRRGSRASRRSSGIAAAPAPCRAFRGACRTGAAARGSAKPCGRSTSDGRGACSATDRSCC